MARLRLIRRLLRRFGQVGGFRRALVAEAVVWLWLARLALISIPFPTIAKRLGTFVPPSDERVARARTRTEQAKLAGEIGWAVTRSARYVPFNAVCLPQAMAARCISARRRARISRSTLMLGSTRRALR